MPKLKRLLLQYVPPGIGLEAEDDDGNLEVRHKALSPVEEVNSESEILALVEELCASEPDILNFRKHKKALLGQLGRLYQVETESQAKSMSKDPSSAELPEARDSEESLRRESYTPESQADNTPAREEGSQHEIRREGQGVVLVNLRGKHLSYNGHLATVVKAKGGKDKYEVEVRSSEKCELLKIKGAEHLLPIVNMALPLLVGTVVVLCKLRNHLELNGCVGRVVDCHDQGQRYEVRTESGQLFRVKAENVVPIEESQICAKENQEPNTVILPNASQHGSGSSMVRPTAAVGSNAGLGTSSLEEGRESRELYDVGCIVEIVGLKSNLTFNHEQATVLLVDREKGRYEVRMSDGSVKKLKAENARLVVIPPSSPLPKSPAVGGGYSPGMRYPNVADHGDHGKRKAHELSLRTPGASVEKLPPATPDMHAQRVADVRPGGTVQLHGLRTQPHLNGQCALVIQDLGDRAEIKLEDGSVKKVRKDNIRWVHV